MAGKISCIMRIAGLIVCLLCTAYMLYLTASRRIVAELKTSEAKTLTIAGMVAVTEGEVVRAEAGHTVIRYYHEWDGTEYQSVIAHVNADYSENAKVPVVYSVGMGAGSCLAVGFYRKPMQVMGVVGAVLLLLGTVLNFKKEGNGKNGKKKDYSRQLEDEHDSQ